MIWPKAVWPTKARPPVSSACRATRRRTVALAGPAAGRANRRARTSSQLHRTRGVALIAQAQARGLKVTADVALYQLILTFDEALIDFSSLYHVQPPLRTRADREDARATVKSRCGRRRFPAITNPTSAMPNWRPFGATEPGISSVELLLPLAMTLVEDGLLDLPTLLAPWRGPAEALRLPAGKLAVGGAEKRISAVRPCGFDRGRGNLAVQRRIARS